MSTVTVRDLIHNLQALDDLDQTVIYQYYLAEHFGVSNETFTKAAEEFESIIPCLTDAHDVIADAVAEMDQYENATA